MRWPAQDVLLGLGAGAARPIARCVSPWLVIDHGIALPHRRLHEVPAVVALASPTWQREVWLDPDQFEDLDYTVIACTLIGRVVDVGRTPTSTPGRQSSTQRGYGSGISTAVTPPAVASPATAPGRSTPARAICGLREGTCSPERGRSRNVWRGVARTPFIGCFEP